MAEDTSTKPPGGTPDDNDPRDQLRQRMSEPASVPIVLGREGDALLWRWTGRLELKGTKYGEKPAAIFTEFDASGVFDFDPASIPNGAPAHVLLLGYTGRDLNKLNPQIGDWVGIRRGPKVHGLAGQAYNKWEVYSAREAAGTIDLSSLADADDGDWSTGAFDEPLPEE